MNEAIALLSRQPQKRTLSNHSEPARTYSTQKKHDTTTQHAVQKINVQHASKSRFHLLPPTTFNSCSIPRSQRTNISCIMHGHEERNPCISFCIAISFINSYINKSPLDIKNTNSKAAIRTETLPTNLTVGFNIASPVTRSGSSDVKDDDIIPS